MGLNNFLNKLFGVETEEDRKKEIEEAKEKRRLKRELKRQEKKVFRVKFKCENCSRKWSYEYPANTQVGYSAFGHPCSKHSWIRDTYGLYNYNCPNCGNDDIGIIKRTTIKN